MQEQMKTSLDNLSEVVVAINGIATSGTSPRKITNSVPEIFLEYVHKALSALKYSVAKRKTKMNKGLEALTKKVNHVASMLGKRNFIDRNWQTFDEGGSKNQEIEQKKKTRLARIKAKSRCHACREIGHWAGDAKCKKPKNDPENGNDTKKNDDDPEKKATQYFPKQDQ